MDSDIRIDTKTVHQKPVDYPVHPISTPIFSSSTFVLEDADHGARLSSLQPAEGKSKYLYSRWGNPTTDVAADMINQLESGHRTFVAATGMAAISTSLFSLLKSGDHLVAATNIYGGTYEVVTKVLPQYGIEVTLVDGTKPEEFERAIRPTTRVIYAETPANPTMSISDLATIAELGRLNGIVTMVDSTFASPYNQNPIQFGFNMVLHSATKYLGGHSDIISGSITVDGEELEKKVFQTLKLFGGTMSPFDAFLLIRGIKTLAVRMERHNQNALAIAQFLESHPKVSRVYYPGLESHPQHELVKRQMRGFGGMIAFEVEGGMNAAKKLIENVKIITLAVSLGGVESLIEHAASMTHTMVPKEERERAGITDGLIRLSVGIESAEDLIQDLKQVLATI